MAIEVELARITSALDETNKLMPQLKADVAEAKAAGAAQPQINAKIAELGESLAILRREAIEAKDALSKQRGEDAAKLQTMEDRIQAEIKRREDAEAAAKRLRFGAGEGEEKTIGQLFVESPQYETFRGNRQELKSEVFFQQDGDLREMVRRAKLSKAALTIANSDGLIDPIRSREIGIDRERMVIEDLFDSFPTESPSGYYLHWNTFGAAGVSAGTVNPGGAAAALAETTALPETELRAEEKTWNVKDMGHIAYVSQNALEDSVYVGRTVDREMANGLDYACEQKILYADGSTNNMQGILHAGASLQTLVWSTGGLYGDTPLDMVRKAKTKIRLRYFFATGGVMHPNDKQTIDLLKGNDAHYIWVSVPTESGETLWALPIIETTAIAAGTVLIADFKNLGHIRNRRKTTVRMSDQFKFSERVVSIACDRRLALVIERPFLGVKLTLDEAPPAPEEDP